MIDNTCVWFFLSLSRQVVLSSCSTFFKRILLDNPCKHPTIIMPSEVDFDDLRAIVEFIYRGEVDVPEGSLQVRC